MIYLSVDSTAEAPKFSWSTDECSRSGVAHLNVVFPDSGVADVAVLTFSNPIPPQAGELDDDVDGCIFSGFLRDEPDSLVTLTGGCPFEDTFEVCRSGGATRIGGVGTKVRNSENCADIWKGKIS